MADTWMNKHLDRPLPRLLHAGERRGTELEDCKAEVARVVALAEEWLEAPATEAYGREVFRALNGDRG
ncbi:hypothetical protein F7Q99_39060 [Streptomyces kaniharaensis]|uniref:Uncharacterized protein n=1 Tax=Streptomyces kaniharaensis TaxID=212423 RepID=A0A6N7L6Z6_9ACTN|nr:hypothetical protein [Streptomyces kaniharaensis]MQS18033.1 hypothetical protein [Streptomyces kaniharaensis]